MNDYLNKDMNYYELPDENSWLTASEAHKIAHDSYTSKDTEQMNEIIKKIYENAKRGETQLYYSNLRANVRNNLTKIGYKLTHSSDQRDDDCYLIEWYDINT